MVGIYTNGGNAVSRRPYKETAFERSYADKIRNIWKDNNGIFAVFSRRKTLVEKFKQSVLVVDSVDEIKLPRLKDIDFAEIELFESLLKYHLKTYLHDLIWQIYENMYGEDGKFFKKIFEDAGF